VYTLWRGTLSVVRRGCSSEWEHAWAPADTQSLSGLKALAQGNCWVRAWLLFGRAPYVRGDRIADYRFGGAGERNFSSMVISNGGGCPGRLPAWGMPRGGLVGGR
jgi:hypothetical protein